MFGYVVCSKESLTKKELDRYQAFYCGLCRVLRKESGQLSGFTLNYDMTFLLIFLTSLYEPEEQKAGFRCVMHPFCKKEQITNRFTAYAADMTILLSYYKCLDDWNDERKIKSRAYGSFLKKSYERVKKQYPRQCAAVSENLSLLAEIEQKKDSLPDEAVNCSGRMLAELFVYQKDFWSESLWQFGYELGRFIYLMDAAMDFEQDKKTGNYNPVLRMGKTPPAMESVLDMIMGNAAEIFERLPMIQDEELLRNIIYAGVWQQFNAKYKKTETTKEKGVHHG